jgi:hypothetical protein
MLMKHNEHAEGALMICGRGINDMQKKNESHAE